MLHRTAPLLGARVPPPADAKQDLVFVLGAAEFRLHDSEWVEPAAYARMWAAAEAMGAVRLDFTVRPSAVDVAQTVAPGLAFKLELLPDDVYAADVPSLPDVLRPTGSGRCIANFCLVDDRLWLYSTLSYPYPCVSVKRGRSVRTHLRRTAYRRQHASPAAAAAAAAASSAAQPPRSAVELLRELGDDDEVEWPVLKAHLRALGLQRLIPDLEWEGVTSVARAKSATAAEVGLAGADADAFAAWALTL